MLPFVYTSASALFIDCALYLRSDRAALYSALSIDFVKQTQLPSLSLSQCLNPWPSTTPSPELLETQNPVSHPPQVIRISKPGPQPSFHQFASYSFLPQDSFYCFVKDCFKGASALLRRAIVGDETGLMLLVHHCAGGSELVVLDCTQMLGRD